MLVALVVEPVLPLPAVAVFALLSVAREPVGAFPAGRLAEHRAARFQVPVQRRTADAAGRGHLAVGKVVRVEQSERLFRAVVEIGPVGLERLNAPDVDVPQVEGRLAVLHPLRQRHARAARRLDADRIEATGDPEIAQVRRFAEIVAVVGREAFGAVEEGVDAGIGQHRHASHGLFEDRLEVVEILRKLVEAEIVRDRLTERRPRLCDRLEGAEQDLAGIFLVVGAFVGNAQHRKLAQPGDRLGDDVEMLAGVQRHGNARHRADAMRPHSGAVDHVLAGDVSGFAAGVDVDARDAAVFAADRRHPGVLDDPDTALARATGQCLCDVGRVALAVEGNVDGADDVGGLEMRVALPHLGDRDFLDVDAVGAAHCGGPQKLLATLIRQRHRNRAALAHAGGDAGLFLQPHVELGGIAREPRHVGAGAQLADQTGGVPGRAAGELLAFQQHDVGPAKFGEMIRDRASGDAAADDDGAGAGGDRGQARFLRSPAR